MTEKIRLELATRLQQVQARVVRALNNSGINTDFQVCLPKVKLIYFICVTSMHA